MTIAGAVGGDEEGEELARLVREAGTGSSDAHAELAERYRGQVRAWAERVVKDPDDAEDVAQGILSSLVRRLATFRGESRFSTWLFRVTRNAALDRRRTDERRAALRLASADPPATTGEELPDVELAALVRSYDHELTTREREVFRMIDLEGVEPSVVAARLGIAPSTMRVLLARARARIRGRMLERHRDQIREAGYDV
ncbi:MAG TPA: sigma-70 family RNA polymerase sigma factor [Gemmatimonadales bacterium]|nr:sigma-70 family RNA polymerase sigma factor [Gemmatimonadales bacterium]